MSVAQLQEYGLEQMDEEAIREFLAARSTGVLGLAADDVPYMLPMSYAYDGDESFYFTYLLGPTSRKQTLSSRAERARLLVYNVETMFNWESVLVTGGFSEVPDTRWSELEEVLTTAWRPELFQTATLSGDVKVYELTMEEATGIRHTGLAPGFREGTEY
jgi:hypothetical protein